MDIASLDNLAQNSPTPPATITPANVAETREVIQAVKALNGAELFGQDNELTFLLDRQTHRPIIRLINRDTGEVIQQIPAEYLLRVSEQLGKCGAGKSGR